MIPSVEKIRFSSGLFRLLQVTTPGTKKRLFSTGGWLAVVILLFFLLPTQACFKKKVVPSWVTTASVIDPDYYTGIGFAPKIKRQKDHVQRAKEDALNELASAVSVQIRSSNTWITIENNDGINEDYRSLIQSRVNAELEKVELVQSYEDKKGYWVYVRLSKREHEASVKNRKVQAAQKAMSFYELALKAESSGDYRQAIVSYSHCLDALGLYLNESVQLQGSTVNLSVHPFERINSILSRLELSSHYDRLSAVAKGRMNVLQLPVQLRDNNQQPVVGFPLVLWYSERAIAEPQQRSNSKGEAFFAMPVVQSRKDSELIVVSVDVQALLAEASVGFEVRRAIQAMPVQKLTIPVELRKPLIQLEIAENQADAELLRNIVLPAYAEALEKAGNLVGVDNKYPGAAVDFRYRIACASRVLGQQSGIVKVQVAGNIQVYNISGQLISTTPISPVEGSHLSMSEAVRQAYQTLAGQMEKRYLF